jgi:hypothetical protein
VSVLIEAISVVVRRVTLEAKYPGGVRQYRQDCPNRTFCMDDRLTRVGLMVPADAKSYVSHLKRLGLTFHRDGEFRDIAVVDQMTGPTAPTPWLEWERYPEGWSDAWAAGEQRGRLAFPPGWTLAHSASLNLTLTENIERDLLPLAREGSIETYLDYLTGRETYVGRVNPESPQ